MYSIGEAAGMTGISAYTLRYYEKIGVLPEARRQGSIRFYDEQDLRYIRFIHGLKQTGMSLADITAFTREGCLLSADADRLDVRAVLTKRIDMLDQHIDRLDRQLRELETVREAASEKRSYYEAVLSGTERLASLRNR